MDYADMKKTARAFRDVATDLSDARLSGLPSGTGTYGYAYLSGAVEQVVEAFNQRHDAIVKATSGVGTTLDSCRLAYQAADAFTETNLGRLLGNLLGTGPR